MNPPALAATLILCFIVMWIAAAVDFQTEIVCKVIIGILVYGSCLCILYQIIDILFKMYNIG